MNNKRVYKIAVWSFIVLGFIIFCSVSNDRLRRRFYAFRSFKGGDNFSRSLKESKKNGTFLWEYEIPQKEIYYKDSIRTIHFAITEAFAEECFGYEAYAPNYIDVRDDFIKVAFLYTDYSNDKYSYKLCAGENRFWGLGCIKMEIGTYRTNEPLPDTIQIYLISDTSPYDGELLPDHGDTLTVINLYKKYEQ